MGGFKYKLGTATAAPAPSTVKTAYAYLDRSANGVTASDSGNITWNGGTLDSLLQEAGQAYWSSFTVTSSYYVQFDFDATVSLQKVTFEQQNTTSHGTWDAQVKQSGVWTSLDSNITWGGAVSNEYAIDAGKQANCTGFRIVGVSGSASNSPFQYEIRFWAVE